MDTESQRVAETEAKRAREIRQKTQAEVTADVPKVGAGKIADFTILTLLKMLGKWSLQCRPLLGHISLHEIIYVLGRVFFQHNV